MKKKIVNNIKMIIKKKIKQNKIKDNFNIIQSKLLDSIDILDIISSIERNHKIKFTNTDLIKIKKLNLLQLSDLISKK
jgi:acyl carrier protein|tara:strand:- start:211 stop:444 length:234 start_codon:yes stop_codon:yes gene_type:complete